MGKYACIRKYACMLACMYVNASKHVCKYACMHVLLGVSFISWEHSSFIMMSWEPSQSISGMSQGGSSSECNRGVCHWETHGPA